MEGRAHVAPKEGAFTLKEIRDAVPKHCFERSTFRSLYYLLRDVAMALLLWAIVAVSSIAVFLFLVVFFCFVDLSSQPWIDTWNGVVVKTVLWAVFAVVQGIVLTGVWVCAHECGHSAFSGE